MKKIYLLVFLINVLVIFSCGPSPKEAAKYHKKIISYHNQVVKQLDILEESFKSFDTIRIRKQINISKKITSKNYKKVIKISALKGDSSLYKADSIYYRKCFDILGDVYEKMYALYALPDEKYGKEGEIKFKKLQAEKDRKFTEAYEQFYDSQNKFVLKYNIRIEKSLE